ncbi:MAG: glycosyltransferase family 39 protein [Bacilli bacterium]|nr:glycosyltransferase family 39 protein [Bacilli bacterium]
MNLKCFNKISNKKLLITFFISIFIFGLLFLPKISPNFDENIEQNILRSNILQYSKILKLNSLTEYYENMGIVPISQSSEKDHGIASYYLASPILLLYNVSANYVSVLWHIYTYSIFFLSVIYIFKLIMYLYKKRSVAFITTMMYFFSPRILIDSLHNNKDIIFMSLLIIMLYYGLRFTNERKYKDSIKFAIVSAFVCNIKVLGLYFLGVVGLAYIYKMIVNKEFNRKNFCCGLVAAIISLVLYFLLTPAIYGSGSFDLVNFITYCLSNSINFRGTPNVLFEGNIYNKSINPLPWYYVPKMISVTLPLFLIVMFLISFMLIIYNNFVYLKKIITFKNKNKKVKYNENLLNLNVVLLIFIVPLAIAIFTRPNLYNGWRHFYFLYGLILIITSFGINHIYVKYLNKKMIYYIFTISLIISLTYNSYCLLKYSVANTAYFNILVKKSNLENYYELDYYGVTTGEALVEFLNTNPKTGPDGKVNLYGFGFNSRVIGDFFRTANGHLRKQINYLNNEQYDEYVDKKYPIYIVSNSVYQTKEYENYPIVFNYKIFDNHIIDIYEKK